MEYNIESILEMYEDDYNPSSKVPGPRNMANGGVIGKPGGLVEENIGYYGKTIELTKDQKKLFNQYKKFFPDAKDSAVSIKVRNNQITEDTITKLKKGISLKATDKDKTALDADTIKKIKEKIKLKPGQKWNFYDPNPNSKTYNPTGHTYGIKKSDNVNLYDKARDIGKPGRVEENLKRLKKKYEEIKDDPKKLAEKKLIDRERYLANREEILENSRLKYETNKQWRKAKLEYERIQRIENPEKYKKKMSDWYAKRGKFPPGNNYKENVWHDMFRSSQKQGQTRFLLVDENGNKLTPDKFPKVDGKVRWDKNANYKNVKFYDTVTKQFVKLDNSIKGKGITFEKYLDQKSVGGKGAYKNAINGYRNKDTIKNITFKDAKGKNIRLGTVMRDKLVQDSNDFIKSGINVQHPDIDNAFWKNEISTTSSNNKLNNLETILKRELRNAGDNTMLRNKALTNFKTKINNLPGGITKVIEGITYGNAPNTESVVAQVGKDFKIDRFKNFPTTGEQVKNAMLEFAGTITDKCKIDFNAEGGRIGFKTGSADCLRIAKEGLEKGLKTGFKKGNQQVLAEGILNSGRFLKDAVSLRGLFGPAALGFTIAAEAGLVSFDMLSKGKSFREAVGDSLFNYVVKGTDYEIDPVEERDKRMVAEGMTPEQMGKIKYFESMMNDMQKGFSNYDNIKNLEKKIEENTFNQQVNPEFFSDESFQLNTQLDKAQAENQDYFRTNRVGELENYFTPRKDGTIPFVEGSATLQEGLRRNELAQLQDAGIGKIYQSPRGDKKRSARIRELMLQNPDVRNYMGSYPPNYGFMEGGIASLNVNKK